MSARELETLAALVLNAEEAASSEGIDERRLAIALGRDDREVNGALRGLRRHQLVERANREHETWRATDAGREATHASLERVAPLVGDWPPPPPPGVEP